MDERKDIFFYFRKKKNGWASNFERAKQIIDDIEYDSNEHYYQSQKAKDPKVRTWIREAPSAWLAMKAGRSLRPKEMVEHWHLLKIIVMRTGLLAKFLQNPKLGKKLIETGNASIHEDSTTDMFWGVKGDDWLGKLLMEVREIIKKEVKNYE